MYGNATSQNTPFTLALASGMFSPATSEVALGPRALYL